MVNDETDFFALRRVAASFNLSPVKKLEPKRMKITENNVSARDCAQIKEVNTNAGENWSRIRPIGTSKELSWNCKRFSAELYHVVTTRSALTNPLQCI